MVMAAEATGSCLPGSESLLKTAPRIESGFTETSHVTTEAPIRPKIAPMATTKVYLPLLVTSSSVSQMRASERRLREVVARGLRVDKVAGATNSCAASDGIASGLTAGDKIAGATGELCGLSLRTLR